MFNLKQKQEPLQLLKYSKFVSTRVGVISLVGFSMALLSLLIQLLNYGAISVLGRKQLALVQLSSGETIFARAVEPDDRSTEVIKKFVSDTLIRMFDWDGLLQTFNEKGEPITKQDPGVEVGKIDSKSRSKVTTKAYEVAFALSENQDFRSSFLRQLAKITPAGIFNGDEQVSLIPRFVSEPRKIQDGKWQVDLVATLVSFNRDNNAGKGMIFNKTITVDSVSSPQEIPINATNLAKKIYTARKSGLEITQIVDLNLHNRK